MRHAEHCHIRVNPVPILDLGMFAKLENAHKWQVEASVLVTVIVHTKSQVDATN